MGGRGGRVDRKGLRGEERGFFCSQELPLKTSQIQQCSLYSYTVSYPIIYHLLQEDLIVRNSLSIETIHPPLAPL